MSSPSPKVVGIIPARFASTRLPGKPLRDIAGKPMIQRVHERCRSAGVLNDLFIATDDQRIAERVREFGGRAIMTSPNHPSGTDRLAETARMLDADIIVNIQGDQPFMDTRMIAEAVQPLLDDPQVEIGTLRHPIGRPEDLEDPAVVKVVTNLASDALYFSRSRIPFPQKAVAHRVFEHVGLYVYRRLTLLRLAELPPTGLEQVESLEQLRWLEHGYRIRVIETQCQDHEFSGFSVDTPADLERATQMARERNL